MYYSYVEIEFVATSFSPARMDLAVKLLRCNISQQHIVLYNKYIFCLSSVHVFNIKKLNATNFFFVAQPKSAIKKISILMTRISAATINPPPAATSRCSVTQMLPSTFVGVAVMVAVSCLVAVAVAVVVVVSAVWQWPGWWLVAVGITVSVAVAVAVAMVLVVAVTVTVMVAVVVAGVVGSGCSGGFGGSGSSGLGGSGGVIGSDGDGDSGSGEFGGNVGS
jgi:hypothetical protein